MHIFVAHTAYSKIIYINYISKYFMNYSKSLEIAWNQLKSLKITTHSNVCIMYKLKCLSKLFSKRLSKF